MEALLVVLSAGLAQGLAAGLSPGPFIALLISEGLRRGPKAAALLATAPLVSDGPIVLAAFLLTRAVPPLVLQLLSLVGGVFVIRMGVGTLREARSRLQLEAAKAPAAEPVSLGRAYRNAVLANALGPGPYIFWTLVGVPALGAAAEKGGGAAVAMLICGFFTGLVGGKMGLGVAAGFGGRFLASTAHRAVLALCGLALLGFGAALAYQGVRDLLALGS
ncbi:MAG TPA: LysE family transporter [Myxococcaceae bacterium]|jgi:threonine/homoserine/homoserine lactone efflux protein